MFYDCLLEITYNKPTKFIELSGFIPKSEISYWCNSKLDIVMINGDFDKNILKKFLINKYQNVEFISKDKSEKQIIIKTCECFLHPMDQILDKYEHIEIPPVKFHSGKELYRMIISSHEADTLIDELKHHKHLENVLIRKLAPIQLNKANYPLYLSFDELRSNLTQRQVESIIAAFLDGYYEIPRKKTQEEISVSLGIKRKTFEEHLRKGENTIMKFIVPLLQFSKDNPK
ncbi:MAG: helix-turn-helix domain-containing protein [Candidatus Thorarchaeota archaeon]